MTSNAAMSNAAIVDAIEACVRRYVVPVVTEEVKRAGAAYEAMQRDLDQVRQRLADVLDRMRDSSRCWNCGAIQPATQPTPDGD